MTGWSARSATPSTGSRSSPGGWPPRSWPPIARAGRPRRAVVAAQTRDGDALRILFAVAEGKRSAYLVELFTAADLDPERLREAQVALNSRG
jgi:hypothetical protein